MRKSKNSSPRKRFEMFKNDFHCQIIKEDIQQFKSPQSVILPSIWTINSGCPAKLYLNPFDSDRDRIKCSWSANKNVTNHNPAFQLDQSKCIINYDPALGDFETENSVMQIEIEDYEEDAAEYFSRIPVQFTTKILKEKSETPEVTSINDRCSRLGFSSDFKLLIFDMSHMSQ